MSAERIRAFRRALEEAVAERRVDSPSGRGLFVDSLPGVYDLNFLRADLPASAESLAAEADDLMESFHHRKVTTEDASVATAFRALGWQATTHLVMELAREPDRRVDTSAVREISFDEVAPLRTLEYTDPSLGAMLNNARRRFASAVPTRWLAAFDGDQPVAFCELRSRDGIAQIEDVNTLAAFRGRGFGRILVQAAIDEARRTDELVFLEALADDWPRELYVKLGFEVVGERQLFLRSPTPLAQLRIRTPRLELRLATVAELRRLYRVAEQGVHDPATMPFEIPWTDDLDEEAFLGYHREQLEAWRTDDWHLNLITFLEGKTIGSQGIAAAHFAKQRTVKTGSWLGAAFQGRGLGTEMRSAILSFAFDTLGAKVAQSGAFVENPQSLGVSRKLGYDEVGSHLVSPRGVPVEHTDLELRRDQFRPYSDVVVSGADPALFGV